MINLGAIARLVNILREFNPQVAQQAVAELWELQQAVNRIDLATQRILELMELQTGASYKNGVLETSKLPSDWQASSNPDNAEAAE